ncbi:MAG: hypothetical protein LT105_15985 [Lentimicrobium sp.]|nr:hypothetical protein [Lentimicrobium sp.]
MWRYTLGWAMLNHYQHLHKQPSKVGFTKAYPVARFLSGDKIRIAGFRHVIGFYNLFFY